MDEIQETVNEDNDFPQDIKVGQLSSPRKATGEANATNAQKDKDSVPGNNQGGEDPGTKTIESGRQALVQASSIDSELP